MSRMIDLIRASAVPATRMHAAARGALTVPPAEMIEILVHLAKHNKIFGQQARLTLAGWDEASACAVASDPHTPSEVLEYMISPQNLRPCLLPALLENPSVSAGSIIQLAESGSREVVGAISKSKRAKESFAVQQALTTNPNFTLGEPSATGEGRESLQAESAAPSGQAVASVESQSAAYHPEEPIAEALDGTSGGDTAPVTAEAVHEVAAPAEAQAATQESSPTTEHPPEAVADEVPHEAADPVIAGYFTEHAAEISAEKDKPFQPVGGSLDDPPPQTAENIAPAVAPTSGPAVPDAPAPSPAKTATKKPHAPPDGKRDNTLQKINKLDVKGRIQLAMKGTKEERSILIRDGTRVVALAVLESPKITDSEVEHYASQKNVLEAVLRGIPLKRRFVKQYGVLRSLVFNPRTPLDVSLGLMKHMLVQDLKNLSSNKEISDTVRKLALKMFKQKLETSRK